MSEAIEQMKKNNITNLVPKISIRFIYTKGGQMNWNQKLNILALNISVNTFIIKRISYHLYQKKKQTKLMKFLIKVLSYLNMK